MIEMQQAHVPRQDLDAEAAVVSGLMLDPSLLSVATAELDESTFYSDANRILFGAVVYLVLEGEHVDVQAVVHWLRDRQKIQDVGGVKYIAELVANVPHLSRESIRKACKRVRAMWKLRAAVEVLHRAAAEGYGDTGPDADEWIRAQAERIKKIAELSPRARAVEGLSFGDVLEEWRDWGPLEHEPTDIPRLDELTGGGPVYGTRWLIAGAPDAGKTALVVQILATWAERGIMVGLLAIDEDPGDILTRWAQRAGFTRAECERRDRVMMAELAELLAELPIRIYGQGWSIERAAKDLATRARLRAEADPAGHPNGPRAALAVDSLQTAHSDAEDVKASTHERLAQRVWALRDVSTMYRMIGLATMEMPRGAYRTADEAASYNDMAAGKGSGALEYQARVQLVLRNVKGERDLLALTVPKNKHGLAGEEAGTIHLRISRARQTIEQTDPPEGWGEAAEDRDDARVAKARAKLIPVAASVVKTLAHTPGLALRNLQAAIRADLGSCSRERADTAIALLGAAVVLRPGPKLAQLHYLDGAHVSHEIMAELDPLDCVRVSKATPPALSEDPS